MTNEQFRECVTLAESDQSFAHHDDTILHGIALRDFKRVSAPKGAVVKFMREQAMQFNGTWDTEALNACRMWFRTKVELV